MQEEKWEGQQRKKKGYFLMHSQKEREGDVPEGRSKGLDPRGGEFVFWASVPIVVGFVAGEMRTSKRVFKRALMLASC